MIICDSDISYSLPAVADTFSSFTFTCSDTSDYYVFVSYNYSNICLSILVSLIGLIFKILVCILVVTDIIIVIFQLNFSHSDLCTLTTFNKESVT